MDRPLTENNIINFQADTKNNPIWFVEKVLNNPLWEKQKEILEAVRDNKEVVVKSCHASGKSYVAGRIVVWWLMAYKNSVVVTTAPTFRQVKEVLWREIKGAVIRKGIFPERSILDTKIDLAENWFAIGLSTDKPGQFQGFHSPHLLVLIDEASDIKADIEEAIDGLTPERVVRLGNPLINQGVFANSFKRENVCKMTISAFDTPNIIEQKIIIPGLITQGDIDTIRIKYGEDSDVYRVRVLGEFPLQDSESLIGVDDISKAIERDIDVKSQFEKKMGVDVARFGDDRTCLIIRQMEKVIRKNVFSSLDTMEITGHVLRIAKEEHILPENINIDVIGIGAGVVDRLREQGWQVNGVNVGTSPEDKEHYLNLRAELYADKVKEWIKDADLTKDDDWYELSNIKYKFNSKGQLQIESKDDMKKRGLSSPDVADALMLTFANKNKIEIPNQSQPLESYYPEIGL